MVKSTASGFEPGLSLLLAVWPWASYSIALCLISLIYKMGTTVVLRELCQLSRTVMAKDHYQGGLKQQKSILSQLWRPEVRNQGAGRTVLPLKAPGEDPSLPLSPSSGSRAPRLVAGPFWSLLWSYGLRLLSVPSTDPGRWMKGPLR